jgi:hypothetical protein
LTAVSWPNQEFTPATGTPYLRLTVRNGESGQPYLGIASKRRSAGVVFGEVFVPSGKGDGAARGLADAFAAMFRNVQHDGITYREPSPREALVQEEPWYRWIVEVPYYRDWLPSGADEVASYNALVITQAAHGFVLGNWLYASAGVWAKAQADAEATLSSPVAVVTTVISSSQVRVTTPGGKANLPAHGLGASGTKVYLSAATAGAATATAPATGFVQQVATVWDADHLIVHDYNPSPSLGG